MGLVRTRVTLENPKGPDLSPIDVEAPVDTGAVRLCVPEHVALQLALEETEKREVTSADGSTRVVSYVGPFLTRFGRRSCFTGAMVLGDDVLLDAIPMDDMDLVVRALSRDLVPNPLNPNIPASMAKGSR